MVDNEYKYRNSISQYLLDENKWICTLRLAKKMFAEDIEFKNLTLSYLWYKFGCYRDVHRPVNAHAAKDDVFMCYQVLIKLVEIAIERGHIEPNGDIGEQIVTFCNTPMRYQFMPFGKHKGEPMSTVPLNYIECDARLIMCNSDGYEVLLNRKDLEKYHTITKMWEKYVGLDMEIIEYKAMYIADVNNYIAIYSDGKVKMKGRYEYKDLAGFIYPGTEKILQM